MYTVKFTNAYKKSYKSTVIKVSIVRIAVIVDVSKYIMTGFECIEYLER